MYSSFLLFIIASTSICKVHSSDFTTEYVGCYKDRALLWAMTFAEDMGDSATIERCTTACYHAGRIYAGLQYSYQCFCSNGGYDRYGEDPGGCNDRCRGNSAQICGDSRRNSVYRITRISSTSPATTSTTTTTTTATTTTTTTTATTTATSTHVTSTIPTPVTARATKNRVTSTSQSTIPTKRPGGNLTDSSQLNNLKQATEPDTRKKNVGTYIGAGVGAAAGCSALIIAVFAMVKKRVPSKKKGESNGTPRGEKSFSATPDYSEYSDVERQVALQAVTERDE